MAKNLEVDQAIKICDKIAKHAEEIAKLRIELVVIRRALTEPDRDEPTNPGTPTSKSQQFRASDVTRHLPTKGRY
jgi:hypothetical protein